MVNTAAVLKEQRAVQRYRGGGRAVPKMRQKDDAREKRVGRTFSEKQEHAAQKKKQDRDADGLINPRSHSLRTECDALAGSFAYP